MRHVRLGRTGLSVSRLCPEQLDDVLRAVAKPIDGALKARLDELTQAYRFGDDSR